MANQKKHKQPARKSASILKLAVKGERGGWYVAALVHQGSAVEWYLVNVSPDILTLMHKRRDDARDSLLGAELRVMRGLPVWILVPLEDGTDAVLKPLKPAVEMPNTRMQSLISRATPARIADEASV